MSGLGRALDRALEPGKVKAEAPGGSAEADVEEVDRLAVRLRGLRVSGPGRSVEEAAERLPDALRVLPERVRPVEVAPGLGGAVLRGDVVEGEYFEGRTDGGTLDLERVRVGPGGREKVPFTLTRDQLRRLVDGVAEG